MKIREVAEYLKTVEKTAYRLAVDGELQGFKIGGSWRFHQSDIDDWIGKEARVKRGVDKDDD